MPYNDINIVSFFFGLQAIQFSVGASDGTISYVLRIASFSELSLKEETVKETYYCKFF